jgi:hypothetical protein
LSKCEPIVEGDEKLDSFHEPSTLPGFQIFIPLAVVCSRTGTCA